MVFPFLQLRGLGHQEANVLSNKLLQQLNLHEKANEYGKNLSGGMKRRLSLGIAIAGNTRYLLEIILLVNRKNL